MTFLSYTYGILELDEIPDKLLEFYNKNKKYDTPIRIIIGTDSQNHGDKNRLVSVISILCEGHGGIYFYSTRETRRIVDVATKLRTETNDSLEIATKLVEMLEENDKYGQMYLDCPILLHIDAGNSEKGKTYPLIPELVGWVRACGYPAVVKPESFVASTIADRITK